MNTEKVFDILKNIRPEYDFTQSSDFVADGYLDSFDMVTLVSDLEDAFDITVDGMDIVPENFNSIEAILSIVKKYGEE